MEPQDRLERSTTMPSDGSLHRDTDSESADYFLGIEGTLYHSGRTQHSAVAL